MVCAPGNIDEKRAEVVENIHTCPRCTTEKACGFDRDVRDRKVKG